MSSCFALAFLVHFCCATQNPGAAPSQVSKQNAVHSALLKEGYEFLVMRNHDKYLCVTASVNDKPAVLIVDTGAFTTYLDMKRLPTANLQWKRSDMIYAGGNVGNGLPVYMASVSKLAIGSFVIDKQTTVHGMDLKFVNIHLGESEKVDGVIGTYLLEKMSAHIDVKNMLIYYKPAFSPKR
jgi:hypothetical protein